MRSVDYGQRHAAELAAPRRVAAAAGCASSASCGWTWPASAARRRHRASRCPRCWPRNSRDLRAGTQHDHAVAGTRLGGGHSVPATSSSGADVSTRAATRTVARSSSQRSRRLARLATKAGVEGEHVPHPYAAHRHDQGRDHSRGRAARRRLRLHGVPRYQADAAGRACGRCDSLPAACRGVRRARVSPIPPATSSAESSGGTVGQRPPSGVSTRTTGRSGLPRLPAPGSTAAASRQCRWKPRRSTPWRDVPRQSATPRAAAAGDLAAPAQHRP